MMFWMNVWALIVLSIGAAYTGEGVAGYAFCMENKLVLRLVHTELHYVMACTTMAFDIMLLPSSHSMQKCRAVCTVH
jgi:hypothetical protein